MPTQRDEVVELLTRVHGQQLKKRLTRVTGQPDVAEEIAQDTYERLLRWEQLEESSPEVRKAVLFATAHRLAIDRVRRAQAATRGAVILAADHADEVFRPLDHPEQQVLAEQAFTRLMKLVDSLPDRLREPWVLRYAEELPRHVICTRLNIPETTLHKRISEARALCLAQMVSDGFDSIWLT